METLSLLGKEESNEVFYFFLLTFIWSWLSWLPLVFNPSVGENPLFMNLLSLLGGLGPAGAAYILTLKKGKITGIITLWKRVFDWKFKKIWFLAIFGIIPIVYISYLIAVIFESLAFNFTLLDQPLSLPAIFILLFLMQVIYGEEFGWRGFAFDRMINIDIKWNFLISSIILGFLWGLWYLPLFFIPNSAQSGVDIVTFIIMIVLYSIFMNWIYLNTEKSLLAALLLHAVFNFSLQVFPILETTTGMYFIIILLLFIESLYIQLLWLKRENIKTN